MTGQKKRDVGISLIVTALIALAIWARMVTLGHRDAPYFLSVSLFRSGVYMGLIFAWGVSIEQRILQSQVRRYLTAIASLCVLWLCIRTVKFFFATDARLVRYLWYGYYFPMLFIPLLAFFVALSLGKPENYRLPRWRNWLYLPAVVLLLAVLSNDFHQGIFAFPKTAAVWTDSDHTYGAGYFFVVGWIVLGIGAAIGIMLCKCRLPHSNRVLSLPFLPVGWR